VELVRLIEMCLNETYNTNYISKHFCVKYYPNDLKQGDSFFATALEYAIR
jgi:hypothetical protein